MPYAMIVSLIGTVCFLGAFGALNLGFLKSDSYIYQIANLLGALCFTYTAFSPLNYGLLITEAAWAIIGAYGIYRIVKTHRGKNATAQNDTAVVDGTVADEATGSIPQA